MSDTILRIEKLENGYEVEVCDEQVMANNQKPKSAYEDPWKGYAFENAEGVVAFIKAHLDKLKPPPGAGDEYDAAFKQATSEEDD
jgi:hypothetical protein